MVVWSNISSQSAFVRRRACRSCEGGLAQVSLRKNHQLGSPLHEGGGSALPSSSGTSSRDMHTGGASSSTTSSFTMLEAAGNSRMSSSSLVEVRLLTSGFFNGQQVVLRCHALLCLAHPGDDCCQVLFACLRGLGDRCGLDSSALKSRVTFHTLVSVRE